MERLIYRLLRFNHSLRQYLGRRLTPSGLALLGAILATGVIGLDTEESLSYQLALFGLALVVVALVASRFLSRYRFARRHVQASRMLPRFGTVGGALPYRILVENRTKRSQSDLKLIEGFANRFPSFSDFQRISRQSRSMTRRRGAWLRLLARRRGTVSPALDLPLLKAQSQTDVRGEVIPLRRGLLHFKQLTLACPEPLGLVNSCITLDLPQSVLILPKRYPLPQIQLPGARRHQSGGLALASSVGDSEEFRSLREYRPGDPPRKIHWKSWAKLGKPVVKEEQSEYFVRHALILDSFQWEEHSEVMEEAVAIAASLACEVQTQESLLDMVFVGLEAHCFTVGRGLGQTERMLELLASVQPCQDRSFASLLPVVQERLSLLSGCICIFLAWDEERKALVEQLQAAGIPTLVLVVAEEETALEVGEVMGCLSDRQSKAQVLRVGRIQEGLWEL